MEYNDATVPLPNPGSEQTSTLPPSTTAPTARQSTGERVLDLAAKWTRRQSGESA
jgi:hypothetical protein